MPIKGVICQGTVYTWHLDLIGSQVDNAKYRCKRGLKRFVLVLFLNIYIDYI